MSKNDNAIKIRSRRGKNRTYIEMSIDNVVFDQLSIRRLVGDTLLVGPTGILYPSPTKSQSNDNEESPKENNFGGFQEILDEMKETKEELTGELNSAFKFINFIRDIITHKSSSIAVIRDLQEYKLRISDNDPSVVYIDDSFLYIRGHIFREKFTKNLPGFDWKVLRDELVDKGVLLLYHGRYVKTFSTRSHYWFNLNQFEKWVREKSELTDEEIEDLLGTCSEEELNSSHEPVELYARILKSAINKFTTKYTNDGIYRVHMNDGGDPILCYNEVIYVSVSNFKDMIMQETLEASSCICEEVIERLRDGHIISQTEKLIDCVPHLVINGPLLKHCVEFPRKPISKGVITIKDYTILVFVKEYLEKGPYYLSIGDWQKYVKTFKERGHKEKIIHRFKDKENDTIYYICSSICEGLEKLIGLFFDSSIDILNTVKYFGCGGSDITTSTITGVNHLELNHSKIKRIIKEVKKASF